MCVVGGGGGGGGPSASGYIKSACNIYAYNTYRVYISSLAGLFNFVLFTRAYVHAECAAAVAVLGAHTL